MSHAQQLGFFAAVVAVNPRLVGGGRVLEIGSYDVNGSMRALFAPAAVFHGVDLVEGPGVDRVIRGAEIGDPDGAWDIVLSGECFEHDDDWSSTLATMVRLARSGGLVAFTCASRGRVEHGTRRTTAGESPGTQAVGQDHYRNVREHEVRALPLDEWFSDYSIHYAPLAADLYFAGVRRGEASTQLPVANLPHAADVRGLQGLMPVPDRLIRLPLVLVSHVSTEKSFQCVAVPYWRLVATFVGWLQSRGKPAPIER